MNMQALETQFERDLAAKKEAAEEKGRRMDKQHRENLDGQEVSKKEKPLQHLAEQLDKPVKAKKEAMGPKRPQEHRKAPLRRTPKRLICLPRKRRVTSESSTNFLPYQVLLSFNF